MNLAYTIDTLFTFFTILILVRVFLTWIPRLDWYAQPLKTLAALTDWYLEFFRRFIPPIGGIGLHPMVAIFVLYIIRNIVLNVIQILGLV